MMGSSLRTFRLSWIFFLLLLGMASCSFFKDQRVLLITPDVKTSQKVVDQLNSDGLEVVVGESKDLSILHEDSIKSYGAIVFSGIFDQKLDKTQQAYLERYCQAGGGLGFLNGVPASEYPWPWAESLKQKTGSFQFDRGRITMNNSGSGQVTNGVPFLLEGSAIDYGKSRTLLPPADSRFVRVVLDGDLNEPMELDVTHDGRVVFSERNGLLKMYLPKENKTKILNNFDVRTEGNYEDGLQGLALDPNHKANGWLYIYYSIPDTDIQRLSRFFLSYDTLLLNSERKILDVVVQTETCCHSGGSVQFGPDGLLYLSTGDNTSSKESDGYSPIDERPGRGPFDAQKSSGNTHDLRGKILRIKVNEDATYSIPDGNLFNKDGSNGRPEIFVMGARNPFRISIDGKRNHLYWGDVGPDSGKDGIQGPQSYDEFNRAIVAGNYGWPYFQANNKPYPDWDFSTNTPGPFFDPQRPVNESPYNTGAKVLPPAREAMIYYPYSESEIWPVLGKGSRSAMAGPVYYSEKYPFSGKNFPDYYDGKLFIYEWSRSWINVVTFDETGDVYDIEPFLPEMDLVKPIDIEFGSDGAMYMLEYGSNYFTNNEEARLSRIEYADGNRKPVAVIEADKTVGAVPLKVEFSGSKSYDYDANDQLQYQWEFTDENEGQGENVSFTFTEAGVYHPKLTVQDQDGATAESTFKVVVGNAPPQIDMDFDGNGSFYFGNHSLGYKLKVTDKEDGSLESGSIGLDKVSIQFHYIPQGQNLDVLGEDNNQFNPFARGKSLIADSDCKSCHDMEKTSIGPSYKAIADHYESDEAIFNKLGQKIIDGGNGVWGHSLMAAHPQHSLAETMEMVKFILSLDEDNSAASGKMQAQGELNFGRHNLGSEEASYILTARYKDNGGMGMPALAKQKNVVFRHPKIQAENCDGFHDISRVRPSGGAFSYVNKVHHGSYLMFKEIDLTALASVKYNLKSFQAGTKILLKTGGVGGTTVAETLVASRGKGSTYREFSSSIKATNGVHDIYLVVENPGSKDELMHLDWLEFSRD